MSFGWKCGFSRTYHHNKGCFGGPKKNEGCIELEETPKHD